MEKPKETARQKEFRKRKVRALTLINGLINKYSLSNDDVLDLFAGSWAESEELSEENERLVTILNDYNFVLHTFSTEFNKDIIPKKSLLELYAKTESKAAKEILKGICLQEIEQASRSGKAGANKRHEPMKQLKKWAIDQYRAGSWPSANKAAYELKDRVIQHGQTIGAYLTKENAQRTLAEWFRKSV